MLYKTSYNTINKTNDTIIMLFFLWKNPSIYFLITSKIAFIIIKNKTVIIKNI